MRFLFVQKSSNSKTGQIPVTYSSSDTCPATCSLKGDGCYAELGHVGLAWRRADNGMGIDELAAKIKALPDGTLFRHNVAGDLPGNSKKINKTAMRKLVNACKGKRGFTYSHRRDEASIIEITKANKAGDLVVNLSADDPAEADALLALRAGPVVTVLPRDVSLAPTHTPGGTRIVVCPAVTRDDTTCATCALCAVVDRRVVVGFPGHGSKAKKAEAKALTFVRNAAVSV
jgi:hypothetical protein